MEMAESNFEPSRQERAFGAFAGFCMEEIGARRAQPLGDYLSRLANEEIDGRRLTDQEIVGLLIGFFFAGHHTDPGAFDRAEEFVLDRKSKPAPASRWSTGGVAATS